MSQENTDRVFEGSHRIARYYEKTDGIGKECPNCFLFLFLKKIAKPINNAYHGNRVLADWFIAL